MLEVRALQYKCFIIISSSSISSVPTSFSSVPTIVFNLIVIESNRITER